MKGKKLTSTEFIERSNKKHNDKYNYSLTKYIGLEHKITIICPKHGSIEIKAGNHINGFGCRKCKSEDSFIKRSNQLYKNKFDYSKMNFNKMSDRVEFVCPVHGSFFQTPAHHLKGKGCRKCNNEK